MKERVGEVFSIARDNKPLRGCTVSREGYGGKNSIVYFSLAKNTDISAEIHPCRKLLIVADGRLEVYGSDGCQKQLSAGEAALTPAGTPAGMRTAEAMDGCPVSAIEEA